MKGIIGDNLILEEYKGTFFPEFYDILHENCNDASAIIEITNIYGKKVLELGCGTGRIAIPLSENGCHVTCVDISTDMINFFQKKQYDKTKINIINCSAEEFISTEKFDVILMCNNFINNFSSINDITLCLHRCKEYMNDNSVIIIEEEVPEIVVNKSLELYNEREIEYKTKNGTIIKDLFSSKYDILNQKEIDRIIIEEYYGNKLLRRAIANDTLYWYWPNEIRKAINDAGLKLKGEANGLSDLFCTGFSLESDSMVFYIKK